MQITAAVSARYFVSSRCVHQRYMSRAMRLIAMPSQYATLPHMYVYFAFYFMLSKCRPFHALIGPHD